jgi:3-oxoacyl-[acyl-carrier protein] reductase
MDITQKVIAITGAGRGLGRAIALSLAEQGRNLRSSTSTAPIWR